MHISIRLFSRRRTARDCGILWARNQKSFVGSARPRRPPPPLPCPARASAHGGLDLVRGGEKIHAPGFVSPPAPFANRDAAVDRFCNDPFAWYRDNPFIRTRAPFARRRRNAADLETHFAASFHYVISELSEPPIVGKNVGTESFGKLILGDDVGVVGDHCVDDARRWAPNSPHTSPFRFADLP